MEPCDVTRIETFDYSPLSPGFAALGKPAQRALINNAILTPAQLSHRTRKDVLKLHGIGKSSLPILEEILRTEGLSFSD